jgi:hypothetical protein
MTIQKLIRRYQGMMKATDRRINDKGWASKELWDERFQAMCRAGRVLRQRAGLFT